VPPPKGWHSIVRSTIRRRRCSGSGIARWRVLMYFGSAICRAVFTYLVLVRAASSRSVVYSGSSVTIGSAMRTAPPCWATWTAPPVISATPAAVAESLAAASLSDMNRTSLTVAAASGLSANAA
jgi:hypothetical protein